MCRSIIVCFLISLFSLRQVQAQSSEDPSQSPTVHPFDVDVAELANVWTAIKNQIALFTPSEAEALDLELPLIGGTFNELIGGGTGKTLDQVFDLATGFVTFCELPANGGTSELLLPELALNLRNYLFQGAVEHLTKSTPDVGVTCNGAAGPIEVDLTSNILTVTICADLSFTRTTNFNTDGLLEALDGFVEVETAQTGIEVIATLSLGAELTVNLNSPNAFDASANLKIDPLVGMLAVSGEVDFTVALGMLDVTTTAAVLANAEVSLTYCGTGCDEMDSRKLPDVDLYLERSADFSLVGDINANIDDFPGASDLIADLGASPSLSIVVADVFDPVPDVTVTPESFNFLDTFQIFSPSNGVALLRLADAALVRAQENPTFNVNLPVVKTSFSNVLATGSVITSKLLEYFVKPEPFEERLTKSLLLAASNAFANDKNLDLEAEPRNLRFFMFKASGQALQTNPDNFDALKNDAGVTKCDFTLSDTPTNEDDFADKLRDKIDGCAGVKACDLITDGCGTLSGTQDFVCSTANCDVVVDVDANSKVFIATVAYDGATDQDPPKDIHLIGLYDDPFTGPGEFFQFPLNQPVNPGLIPQFRNFKDLSTRINSAIASETKFSGVTVDFKFVDSGVDAGPRRFEVDLAFDAAFSTNAGVDASFEWGDLADIKTDAELTVTGSASFDAKFGVILEPDDTEELVLIGTACSGANFDCEVNTGTPFQVELTVVDSTTDPDTAITAMLDLSGGNMKTPYNELNDALIASSIAPYIISVNELGTSLLSVVFDASISEYVLKVPKDCYTPPKKDGDTPVQTNKLTCSTELSGEVIANDYGLIDETLTKKQFQLAIGPISLQGNLAAAGMATVVANVGGVIEVDASVDTSISGSVDLTAGDDFLPAVDWIVALTKVFMSESEGHRAGFLTASADFGGTFNAQVQAAAPFDFIPQTGATGSFTGFNIDFLDPNATKYKPSIDFEVDLPQIGNVRKLSFEDVIQLLQLTLEYLIGNPNEGHTVESCSGGVLGMDIGGEPVFTFPLPAVGFSVCQSMGFLQVLVDAVAELTGVSDSEAAGSTFSALETKLESLLQDTVGGTPTIDLKSADDGTHSDLTIDLELKWSFMEAKELNLDLGVLLADLAPSDPVEAEAVDTFRKAFSPTGQAGIEVGGELIVTLDLGVEYSDVTKRATPYLSGTTGLEVTFKSKGVVEFGAAIGPLTGNVMADFEAGTDSDPLKLAVGLDNTKKYYLLDPQATSVRPAFEHTGSIASLVNEVEAGFSGAANANVEASVPLINAQASVGVQITNVNDVFLNTANAIMIIDPEFSVGLEKPSFLQILLSDPQAIVDALALVLDTAEAASLGPNGIVTNFEIDYIPNAINDALGAGTPRNVLAVARNGMIGTMQETLNKYEDGSGTVADLLGSVITDVLQNLELMEEQNSTTVECFQYNDDPAVNAQELVDCTSSDAGSVQWTVPIGDTYSIEIPVDFSVGSEFPLSLSMEGTPGVIEEPTLSLSWSFDLAFGFDENEGFFLQTKTADATSELSVQALLDIPSRTVDAQLFFLNATLNGVCLQVGAGINIDISKESALRLTTDDPPGPMYGRMTIPQLKTVAKTQTSDLFEIQAVAGAALLIEDTSEIAFSGVPGFEQVEDWIPKLTLGAAVQLRKEKSFGVSSTGRRRLSTSDPRRGLIKEQDRAKLVRPPIGSPHRKLHETNHPALPLLRSLGAISPDNLVDTPNFALDFACPVDVTAGEFACAKILNIALDIQSIQDLVTPILTEFVNPIKNDGCLDEVVQPLLILDKEIEPLTEVTKKAFTMLLVAEIFVGPKSGADTVRKIFKIYRDIQAFVDNLLGAEGFVLADVCDVLAGFECFGGLAGSRRRLAELEEMEDVFVSVDRAGLPVTLADSECYNHRELLACPVAADCSATCSDCTGLQRTACKAKVLQCKGASVDGLDFPPLSDPLKLLELLKGDDIVLIKFTPPPVTFAFEYNLIFPLFVPPQVNLEVGFGFTAELTLGFALDSRGIREAFEQDCPLKALNSFALQDTFDEVDLPMIRLTGSVELSVSVSAAIVKISVYGGVTFIVTIDLFDPFPEESNGLVRPFELLSLESTPDQWFEFKLEIYVNFGVSIKVGIFIGPFEITLFEYGYEITVEVIDPLIYTPPKPLDIATLNDATGHLVLTTNKGPFLCTKVGGSLGEEEIECLAGSNKLTRRIKTFGPVKSIGVDGNLHTCEFQGIESPTAFNDVNTDLILDYSMCQYKEIAITGNGLLAGGTAITTFDHLGQGTIKLPRSPEVALLFTEIQDCNDVWTLEGHTNLRIKGSEIRPGCVINADGGEFYDARLIIECSELANGCSDGVNEVVLSASVSDDTVIADITNSHGSVQVSISSKFKSVEVYMSECDDVVKLENTLASAGYVVIEGRGGDDMIKIGSSDGTNPGLDAIHKSASVDGGEGADSLMVLDQFSTTQKLDGTLSSFSVDGLMGTYLNETITYKGFEEIAVGLSNEVNHFNVTSTAPGSETDISAQGFSDVITIFDTQGNIDVWCGAGNDAIYVYGLGDNVLCKVFGEAGHDVLTVDGTGNSSVLSNALDLTTIRWSGGLGNDVINAVFASTGTSNINLAEDIPVGEAGSNELNVDCADFACFLLSRENFLANAHELDNPNSTAERINIERTQDPSDPTKWIPNVSIESTFIRLNGGENKMFFDDTLGIMDVQGGPLRDEFRIGQLYNSERDEMQNVAVSDPITTTLTTRGWLSNGCSHPITLNGDFGNDLFDVLRNKQVVNLNGQSGDDVFVVRSFIALVIDENGNVLGSDSEKVTAIGGDDSDTFDIKGDTNSTSDEPFDVKGEDPDYVVNSLVDIDGGTGTDTLFVSGTEQDDSYVVADGAVFGGGLTINFANIESLQVDCKEGNDLVSVLSTGPALSTTIYGNKGSDRFEIAPRDVAPVTSRNLRGHRGILEHEITSSDTEYDQLLIEGVAVDILDNDGEFGYVNFVQNEAVYLLFEEDTTPSQPSFTFTVYPTRRPKAGGKVVVEINAQSDSEGNAYMILCHPADGCDSTLRTIELVFTDMTPQEVGVKYNPDAIRLAITEENLIIKSVVDTTESDEEFFTATEQSITPINVKLIPHETSAEAKSVTVVEPTGRTFVAEDGTLTADYDIYLRPCNQTMRDNTKLTVTQSVSGQVELSTASGLDLSTNSIIGDHWLDGEGECKVTVTVTAVDDNVQEGDHFVALGHVVTDAAEGEVLLSDDSPLCASNILVRIYDNDLAGVVIDESLGYTATAEIDLSELPSGGLLPSLYEDSYRIRLSKEPNSNVTVTVQSVATATDRLTPSTMDLNRNYTERTQVEIAGDSDPLPAQTISLVFTQMNWDKWQTVNVFAIDDSQEEGVDLLYFPSQPSFLAFIQGPIRLEGAGFANIPQIEDPLLFPGETDDPTFSPDFELPGNGTLEVIEANQVDYLIIHNTDVRGDQPTIGTLTSNQLVGMNMAENIVINGEAQMDGITYYEMEVVEINLGRGVDQLTVLNTSHAMHLIDLGEGDDSVLVEDVSGPFLIHGRAGADTVTVASEDDKLEKIQALLGFDGGAEDTESDHLILNNSGDTDTDEVLNVTRFIVEVASMDFGGSSMAPSVSYLLNFRGATGGEFTLSVSDPVKGSTSEATRTYPLSGNKYDAAVLLESVIQRMIIAESEELDSCGNLGTSKCANAVKVWPVADDAFAVFFAGERLGEAMELELATASLEGFDEEMFLNQTNDIIKQNSDVCYSNLEKLEINMGDLDHVVLNVRGTSATAETKIQTQAGDDYVFISSEANEDVNSSIAIDYLLGWLDYVEHDLIINTDDGRHRLLISDERSTIAKGLSNEDAMKLTKDSLTNIHADVGDIFFNTGGNWSAGVNLWLGREGDRLDVLSVPANPGGHPFRTTTSVHAGPGNDELAVALDMEDHEGAVFVANGQYGDDTIDASQSTHPVILFGGRGNDTLVGGSSDDVILGDLGRVEWREYADMSDPGIVVASAGGGGYGDFTDGLVRNIAEIFSTDQDVGGMDNITTGDGDNVAIGGEAGDDIKGGNHRDILFGDSALITYHKFSNHPRHLYSISCEFGGSDTVFAGDGEVDYIVGGSYNDTLYGEDGMDLVFGDNAMIVLDQSISHKLIYATTTDPSCQGGEDMIYLGAGDDLAFGGALSDTIHGGPGQDAIFGDFGEYDANTEFLPYQNYRPITAHPEDAAGDYLYGDEDDDIIFCQEGADYAEGGSGFDDIIGGSSIRFGEDTGDELHGGEDGDVILGDNGQILRIRLSESGTYPWVHGSVWLTYPEPFDKHVVRNVSRYDDIDYVQGNDTIYGGSGDDELHGQRGDDEIHGGEGEDELYGELGSDKLYGGPGNDILIGDIGYCVRRYDKTKEPILQMDVGGTASTAVWHKDIVLEELGNITKVTSISTKVDTQSLSAEETTSASLMFAASAVQEGGGGKFTKENGEWPVDLLLFDLVPAHDDILVDSEGSNVLIGQRGDDTLTGGDYSDLLIGDAGQNLIPQNTDLPRIYQIYRTLSAPNGSGYEVGPQAVDYGVVFTADFDLYPNQYRYVDYLQSLVDVDTTLNDVQEDSDLLKDIIGASALATDNGYCMQPMFRITPGFTEKTQQLHGNDILNAGSGDTICIGDDIRGATPFDLSQLADVDDLRQDLDNLVMDLSVRLSTMEVDKGFFLASGNAGAAPIDLRVACDTITTDPAGQGFVTGDSLTMFGRSFLGGSLGSDPEPKVVGIVNRLRDIEWVLLDVHLALYELHTDLLERMSGLQNEIGSQVSQYALTLASDEVTSYGSDFIMGDSAVLFAQANRGASNGFEFEEFSQSVKQSLSSTLRTLKTSRDDDRAAHVDSLQPSAGLTNQQQNNLPLADVPFLLTACTDTLNQTTAKNLGVGDYGFVGFVSSSTVVDPADTSKDLYADSMENVRKRPAVSSFFEALAVLGTKIPFYEERYSSQVSKVVEPSLFGDSFFGYSVDNAMLGEFATAIGYGDPATDPDGANFVFDSKTRGVFDTFDNADFAQVVDGDTFTIVDGTLADGQKGKDIFNTQRRERRRLGNVNVPVESFTMDLFYKHSLIRQWVSDIYNAPVDIATFAADGIKVPQCPTDFETSSFIPPDIQGGPSQVFRRTVRNLGAVVADLPVEPSRQGMNHSTKEVNRLQDGCVSCLLEK